MVACNVLETSSCQWGVYFVRYRCGPCACRTNPFQGSMDGRWTSPRDRASTSVLPLIREATPRPHGRHPCRRMFSASSSSSSAASTAFSRADVKWRSALSLPFHDTSADANGHPIRKPAVRLEVQPRRQPSIAPPRNTATPRSAVTTPRGSRTMVAVMPRGSRTTGTITPRPTIVIANPIITVAVRLTVRGRNELSRSSASGSVICRVRARTVLERDRLLAAMTRRRRASQLASGASVGTTSTNHA
jgi:hypothetical protein